jgi:hypothetical protein
VWASISAPRPKLCTSTGPSKHLVFISQLFVKLPDEEQPARLLQSVTQEKQGLEEALGKMQDEKLFIERCLEDARQDVGR